MKLTVLCLFSNRRLEPESEKTRWICLITMAKDKAWTCWKSVLIALHLWCMSKIACDIIVWHLVTFICLLLTAGYLTELLKQNIFETVLFHPKENARGETFVLVSFQLCWHFYVCFQTEGSSRKVKKRDESALSPWRRIKREPVESQY